MLLADDWPSPLRSVGAESITDPVIPHPTWRTPAAARAWLDRFPRSDYATLQALRHEVARGTGARLPGGSSGPTLLDIAARGLASGRIGAVRRIPAPLRVTFDEHLPFDAPFPAVIFPGLRQTRGIVTAFAADPAMADAVARAWAFGVASFGLVPGRAAPGRPGQWEPEQVATLLAYGTLMLLPYGPVRTHLRLAWRRPLVAHAADAPPPDVPVALPRTIPSAGAALEALRSAIPAAPSTVSLQAAALLAAAAAGVPFCEDCPAPAAPVA